MVGMPTTVTMVTFLDRESSTTVGFAAALERHGDRLAIVTADEAVTYADLARRADAVGERLGEGRRLVLVKGENRLGSVVAYLGALRAGHVPLVVPGRKVDLRRIAGTFDADAVLGADEHGDPVVEDLRSGTGHELHPSLALLLTTSGSTGAPRAVRLSHENLEANASAIATYLSIDDEDRAITSLPLHYCYGLSVLHSHLARGAGVALTDRSVVDRCFWDLFRAQRCTSFAGVPFTFELLDRVGFDELELPTLRYVTQAGGRLAPDVVRRYAALGARHGWDLVVMYGQTEATARMAYLPPHLAASRPEAIGIPIPGGSFSLDEGELVYRGPNVMLGYAEGPADLALDRTIDELRTGDLARRGADGLYEIVGRASRFAKIAGTRIDLDDVEGELHRSGATTACTTDDERLIVGLVTTSSIGVDDVGRLAADHCGLPAARVAVVPLEEVPRLPSGKPDLEAVRAGVVGPAVASRAPAPRHGDAGEVHPAVRALLVDVLRVPEVAGDDTFVSLGGDSLSYVEVSIGLEEVVGELPPYWHTTPLRELVPPESGRRRRMASIETTIVVRALAIALIAANHVGVLHVLGGAHALLGIGGWNFARFGERTADRLRSIARIAVPSVLWLGFAALTLTPRLDLDHVLLVHQWVGDRSAHGGYWYVETIVQLLLGVTLLLALPPVARLVRGHPFGAPVALAVAGLAVRFDLVGVPVPEPHDIRPHDIVWIFALGWAAAEARTVRARVLVSALLVVGLIGFFDESHRAVVVALALLSVVWVPTVRLPRVLVRPVAHVAAASLAIYLTHWQVFPPVRDALGGGPAYVASLGVGVLAWSVVSAAARVKARAGRPA
jgi:acyl-CoA synthetase (AMP-forming)/AMP-acid ligase II